jgi:cysteinyl-tRNA synthetase
MQIYNSLSQKKEEFVPLTPGQVKMYVCGPTVYNLLHIGNFRGPIFFNLVRNWFERTGLKVTFVYNYTDVDDRIIKRAIDEKVESSEISEKYIAEFQKDFSSLKLRPHDQNPKVTEYMEPIIKMVGTLIERDKAYVKNGEVLYSVRKFTEYGKLSHKNVDDLMGGTRVEVDQKKQDPLDFALWKPAKPGEPKWPSPWSDGRPGWHIECSAMIHSILGESIDIHGGGMDLLFPHHENEIAQSEGATGKPFVKYWMHNNMLNFGAQKMSKSVGNVRTTRDFVAQYNGEILKFMMLSSHYRSILDFSEQPIANAIAGLARLYSSLALAEEFLAPDVAAGAPAAALQKVLTEQEAAVATALNDDFNTPETFAAIYTVVRAFNSMARHGQKVTPELKASAQAFHAWILRQGEMMSLFQEPAGEYLRLLDDMLLEHKKLDRAQIDVLVEERSAARAAKDFKRSDELRDQLVQMGIALQDMPGKTIWEVQK